MESPDSSTIVLGAGYAGLSAAYELSKNSRPVIIVEKDKAAGGLAKTLQFGEFRTDVGPHRFFSQKKLLYSYVNNILKGRMLNVNRFTRFYVGDKSFLYPVDLVNVVSNLAPAKAVRIVIDYACELIKRFFHNNKCVTLEEKLVADFGRELAGFNMLGYSEKIWGLPCSQISADWARQRIRGVSLFGVLKNMLSGSKVAAGSFVSQFCYPETGSGLVFDRMLEDKAIRDNAVLKTGSYPLSIIHEDNAIRKIFLRTPEKDEELSCRGSIISSIPITTLVRLLSPDAPPAVLAAASRLRFRSHVSLFVTLNKPSVFREQWIYFPDKQIPFGRIMEPKNFSIKMSPEGKTSLLIEFFCWENDPTWNADKKELFEMSIVWLEKYGFIGRGEVIETFVHREKYAYPVYDLMYADNLKVVKAYLAGFKNLICVGRSGLFRYNNQDHALEMGIRAAMRIISGKKDDIEAVSAERQYFESGMTESIWKGGQNGKC